MKTIAQQLKVKEFPFIIKDSNDNQIYYEDSDGYWIKREFDSNGNEIYYENPNGYWTKSEFDSNGNLIYYEDSDGVIEDHRNITEYKIVKFGIDKLGNFILVKSNFK